MRLIKRVFKMRFYTNELPNFAYAYVENHSHKLIVLILYDL